jgi:hypothetical protein
MPITTLLLTLNYAVAAVREVLCAAGDPQSQTFHEDALTAFVYIRRALAGDVECIGRVSPYWQRSQVRFARRAFDEDLPCAAYRAMVAMDCFGRGDYKWAEINAGLALDAVGMPHKCQPFPPLPGMREEAHTGVQS